MNSYQFSSFDTEASYRLVCCNRVSGNKDLIKRRIANLQASHSHQHTLHVIIHNRDKVFRITYFEQAGIYQQLDKESGFFCVADHCRPLSFAKLRKAPLSIPYQVSFGIRNQTGKLTAADCYKTFRSIFN